MDGKLIIEVYEYAQDALTMPSFEYVPCELSNCLGRGNKATLKEIIQRGFDSLPKKSLDSDKRQEVLQKLDDADIGRIGVAYHGPSGGTDAYIELTNVMPVDMTYADARRVKGNKDDIILYGKYRLSEGNQTTVLKDAQRLTLTYSNYTEDGGAEGEPEDPDNSPKEICLNITYLQE